MKRSAFIALAVVYIAMVGAAIVSRVTFERLPHLEDEFAYLYQARIFETGAVYMDTLQPNRAYWQPFLINYEGKRFGKYPPGWPLLLAIGTGLKLPWVVNLWMAGLSVALVYRLGREIFDEVAGLAGALLLAFSPMALLLNATLMGHTSALTLTLLFMYGLWRVERGSKKNRLKWGLLSGLALGFLVANRPLAAVGVALPFILYSGLRVGAALIWQRRDFWPTLRPLLALSAGAIALGSLFPAYNYIVTGDPTTNLYTFIWTYDRIGFGEGHGRYSGQQLFDRQADGVKINLRSHAGHSWARANQIMARDTACLWRDLFGWVGQPDNPPREFTALNDCLRDDNNRAYSWLLLPFGLAFVFIRSYQHVKDQRPKTFEAQADLIRRNAQSQTWAALLGALIASLLVVQMSYWIGAGVYSARYYFEAAGALTILSGAGVSFWARLLRPWGLQGVVYALLGIAILGTTLGYTPKRLEPLRGYGRITGDLIAEVEAARTSPDIPVMVIAWGTHHWRDIAPLMAVTDPLVENDIIGLRDADAVYAERLIAQHPEREVFFLVEGALKRLDEIMIPAAEG